MTRTERQKRIAEELIARAESIRRQPRKPVEYAKDENSDRLINDLENYPSAFFIGVLVDRQIKSERAWRIPLEILHYFRTLDPHKLSQVDPVEISALFKRRQLHRFNDEMSRIVVEAMCVLVKDYDGNAANIWNGNPSSALVIYRFLQFRGVGQKLATMAANLLARDFKVPFSDYYSIDISLDVHVKKVFTRLGLVDEKASPEQLIFCARSMSPEYPGLLDYGAFRIGRDFCKPTNPDCSNCYLRSLCEHASRVD